MFNSQEPEDVAAGVAAVKAARMRKLHGGLSSHPVNRPGYSCDTDEAFHLRTREIHRPHLQQDDGESLNMARRAPPS